MNLHVVSFKYIPLPSTLKCWIFSTSSMYDTIAKKRNILGQASYLCLEQTIALEALDKTANALKDERFENVPRETMAEVIVGMLTGIGNVIRVSSRTNNRFAGRKCDSATQPHPPRTKETKQLDDTCLYMCTGSLTEHRHRREGERHDTVV